MSLTVMEQHDPPIQTRRAEDARVVGVVHGPGGVHFVAVAARPEELWPRLCVHVRTWAPYQLDGEAAAQVREAMARGDDEAAARLYFTEEGRWERESLLLRVLSEDGSARCERPDSW